MRSAKSPSTGAGSPVTVSSFPAAVAAVDRVLAVAAPVVAKMVDAALPTQQTLRALADEVRKAMTQPKSVAHPELADPDTFWRLVAFPQASSLVRQLRGVLVEVAAELGPVVESSQGDVDAWLRATVAAERASRQVDPDASRERVIDQIAGKCAELHDVIAGIGALIPRDTRVDELRRELAHGRRKRVQEAVKRTGDPYEVADARLRHEPPHRHQDLALDAQLLAHEALRRDVEAMVVQLTGPIFGLGEHMVLAYGVLAAEMDCADAGLPDHAAS